MIYSALSPSAPVQNTQNWGQRFDFFSKAINDDGVIRKDEFKKRVLETLDAKRPNNRWYNRAFHNFEIQGTQNINYSEFDKILLPAWGDKFANRALGYYSGMSCGGLYFDCWTTYSPPVEIDAYCDRLIAEIENKATRDLGKTQGFISKIDGVVDCTEFYNYLKA